MSLENQGVFSAHEKGDFSKNFGILQLMGRLTFVRALGSWLVGPVREISLKQKGNICFEGCVSASFPFLHDTRYFFLAIYVESNILVHESLL